MRVCVGEQRIENRGQLPPSLFLLSLEWGEGLHRNTVIESEIYFRKSLNTALYTCVEDWLSSSRVEIGGLSGLEISL